MHIYVHAHEKLYVCMFTPDICPACQQNCRTSTHQLQFSQLLMQGKTYKYIADDVAEVGEDAVGHTMRGHRLPVTCVGISGDEKFAYSGGKDSMVCQCESARRNTLCCTEIPTRMAPNMPPP